MATTKEIALLAAFCERTEAPQMEDGHYTVSIHPFYMLDLMLDESANSVIDTWKHMTPGSHED